MVACSSQPSVHWHARMTRCCVCMEGDFVVGVMDGDGKERLMDLVVCGDWHAIAARMS